MLIQVSSTVPSTARVAAGDGFDQGPLPIIPEVPSIYAIYELQPWRAFRLISDLNFATSYVVGHVIFDCNESRVLAAHCFLLSDR